MAKREVDDMEDVSQDIELSSGEEDDEVYVVEKILQHKKERNGKMQYLIKWEGYPDSENTWESEENVFDQDLITRYWAEREKKPAKSKTPKANGEASVPVTPTLAKRRRADEKPTPSKKLHESDSWESEIDEIETIDRNDDRELIVYINWKNGDSTEHPIEDVYKKCPYSMLKFYESRLRFRSK